MDRERKNLDSENPNPRVLPAPTKGGWKSIFYILGNESFERLASTSLNMNLSVYLKTKYNLYGVFLINLVSIWSGCTNILPLLGAFIAEKYLGRFRMLLYGCTVSFLGMGMMTLTAAIPRLRPKPCGAQMDCENPSGGDLTFLIAALGLIAIGAGAIRPCCIAFGADQFLNGKKVNMNLQSFYNWWYLSFTATLIIVLTVVVYIQTKISWVIGLAIPTGCLALAIFIFLLGRHTYILVKPQGSVYAELVKVTVASWRKRHLTIQQDDNRAFYEIPTEEHDLGITKLVHTKRFKFLDKAAIVADPSELDSQGRARNRWRLCSLQQVEQLKCLVAIAPAWISGIVCFLAMDQQNVNGILQAFQMDMSIGPNFQIPPSWLSLSSMIVLSIWIFIYECIIPRASKKFRGKNYKKLTIQQRMNVGIVMAILCMSTAAIVERKRRETALKHKSMVAPVSVAWLVPQFALSGLVEAFAAIAVMELLTSQVPENLRTIGGAINFLSLSLASYLTSSLVSTIHKLTGRNGNIPWVGGKDLNGCRLDYYYVVIASLSIVNLVYYNLFAKRFLAGVSKQRKEDSPNR